MPNKTQKNKAKKYKNKVLLSALLFTIMFIAGIPLIIIGASRSVVLLITGIFCVVMGFYVMPLLWVKFGTANKLNSIACAIFDDGLTNISEIASQAHSNGKETIGLLKTAIEKRIIEGFTIDSEKNALRPLKAKDTEETVVIKCSCCGATYRENAGNPCCPYCGTPSDVKKE